MNTRKGDVKRCCCKTSRHVVTRVAEAHHSGVCCPVEGSGAASHLPDLHLSTAFATLLLSEFLS